MAKHAHNLAARLSSGMYGNGGRRASNGGLTVHTDKSSVHARPQAAYRVANADGAGLERHRGHKFSQARYESPKMGW